MCVDCSRYICSGTWDSEKLGGPALSHVFDAEWWQTQEHPKDAFVAGNLIKIWFRGLSPKLLDNIRFDDITFANNPEVGELFFLFFLFFSVQLSI